MLLAYLYGTRPSRVDLFIETYYILSLQELPPYSISYREWVTNSMQDFVDRQPPLYYSPVWFLLSVLRRASRRLMSKPAPPPAPPARGVLRLSSFPLRLLGER